MTDTDDVMQNMATVMNLAADVSPTIDAATVALVRDGDDGLETLLLRKTAKIAFGGMWVFPGGRVDDEDRAAPLGDDALGGFRAAALREAAEEADVILERDADAVVPLSFWVPPALEVKRFATWFFVARVPAGEAGDVTIDDGEILEQQWGRPADFLARRDAGELQFVPPTWISLFTMTKFDTVESLLAGLRETEPEHFVTHAAVHDGSLVTMWEGDAGYETVDPAVVGTRHRLSMTEPNWRYERS